MHFYVFLQFLKGNNFFVFLFASLLNRSLLLKEKKNSLQQQIIFFKNRLLLWNTVDSRYLEVEGTLWNTSRYPYFDISDVQNWRKYQSNKEISQMNM